jgi:hypothetical protein
MRLGSAAAGGLRTHYVLTAQYWTEILCQATDGCSRFRDLLFRREWPYFLALVLLIDGEDLRALPLVERKCRLARVLP